MLQNYNKHFTYQSGLILHKNNHKAGQKSHKMPKAAKCADKNIRSKSQKAHCTLR